MTCYDIKYYHITIHNKLSEETLDLVIKLEYDLLIEKHVLSRLKHICTPDTSYHHHHYYHTQYNPDTLDNSTRKNII